MPFGKICICYLLIIIEIPKNPRNAQLSLKHTALFVNITPETTLFVNTETLDPRNVQEGAQARPDHDAL